MENEPIKENGEYPPKTDSAIDQVVPGADMNPDDLIPGGPVHEVKPDQQSDTMEPDGGTEGDDTEPGTGTSIGS